MDNKIEQKLDKLLDKLDLLITDQGLRISGNGMIANNTEKILEKLDQKVQKQLYFMEKRQLAWKQEWERLNHLPVEEDKSKN